MAAITVRVKPMVGKGRWFVWFVELFGVDFRFSRFRGLQNMKASYIIVFSLLFCASIL